MSAETLLLGDLDGRDGLGAPASPRLARRLLAAATALGLALALAGDRGQAATVPATIYGQDPLEVLSLSVRPNVIVVLDSSGSMTNNTPESDNTNSGDHPRSKMYQAKKVLRQLVQSNQGKVSFQLGTYAQYGFYMQNQGAGEDRFQYTVSGQDASFMDTASTELEVLGAVGDSAGRGLQSWQIIYDDPGLAPRVGSWKTLYFSESNGAACSATLSGPFPKFYARGTTLATELQSAMNGASCSSGSRQNTYSVSYDTGSGLFTFSVSSGPNSFQLRPSATPNNIARALGGLSSGWTTWTQSGTPYTLLYRNAADWSSGFVRMMFTETIGGTNVNFYQLRAGRLWNGEVVRVNSSGEVCGMDFATAATKTSPPSVTIWDADSSCNLRTNKAVFTFSGAAFSHDSDPNGDNCRGFRSKSDLIPCDLQTSRGAPAQMVQTGPYIDLEFPFDTAGNPVDLTTNGAAFGTALYGVPDGVSDYVENQDGSWAVRSVDVAPSAKAEGYTPIANSLIDIKGTADGSLQCVSNSQPPSGKYDPLTVDRTLVACPERGFTKLWKSGQAGATAMAGPWPWKLDPIKDHKDPKEKTIVLFVTDGDDTCGTWQDGSDTADMDLNALRAAYRAQLLYTPVDSSTAANKVASSVSTYVIGFGGAFSGLEPYRLNEIAWGGSGLGQGTSTSPLYVATTGSGAATRWDDTYANLKTKRAKCTTCQDAFIAPDAATLATTLQSLIDQGASEGEFSSSQSITETSVFEYVDRAATNTCSKNPSISCSSDAVCISSSAGTCNLFDARIPATRYSALAPTRFISSFTLPGFKGQFKAYQYDATQPGNVRTAWSGGDKLSTLVNDALLTCSDGLTGECTFASLKTKIARRIYTTSRNGRYTFTVADLASGTFNPPERLNLWPTDAAIAPTGNDWSSQGILDQALGLPTDSAITSTTAQGLLTTLQDQFKACKGTELPSQCTASGPDWVARAKAARREARDMIFAFMAGATAVPSTDGLKRTPVSAGSPSNRSQILYTARSSVLADAELATPAVITQPLQGTPDATPYVADYKLFTEGPRLGNGSNPDTSGSEIKQGFGLTNPDKDTISAANPTLPDTRSDLKPVMSVVYAPGNDMLHAFRAGPCYSPSTSPANCVGGTTPESGGEELWGFVPFDMLDALRLRVIKDPQGRDNHVYMLTRGIRYADVYVPASPAPVTLSIGGQSTSVNGVWRRVIYFGRGIGGKYLTALDVTGPGPYTATRLNTQGPIPLWSRGNPDTQNGLAGGTNNNTATDRTKYAGMGETWSMPAVAWVDAPFYGTAKHVLFVGSGYASSVSEGTTFYTLDAITGNVIAAADVGQRSGMGYLNALPANPAGFNPKAFSPLTPKHPSAEKVTRVYIGDVHGRLWKFLTASPGSAILAADLGADQPVATAAGLLGMPFQPGTPEPYVYVTSGADRRANGPFKIFGFHDKGTDTDITTTGPTVVSGVTTYAPVEALFQRTFDAGTPAVDCGYTDEAVFRGNVQPATTYECTGGVTAVGACTDPVGRVFFAGNRLSPPNTKFAAPTPLACGDTGQYPCRSQFDAIIYALGAKTGFEAYDLNNSGDDAYRIFRDSRIAAIQMVADPDPTRGGSSFRADESLMKGTPQPPPPAGVPPTVSSQTKNVVMTRQANKPPPAVRYGSTVCQ